VLGYSFTAPANPEEPVGKPGSPPKPLSYGGGGLFCPLPAAVLHGLKGVLPLFCAPEMAQRIIDLEAVCKAGAGDAARAAWPLLRADMLDLHEEVRVIIEKAA
jgi:hypothetical protein